MTPDEIAVIITQAAQRHGVPTEALMAIANIESSGNIAAENPRSSASGLFQFVDTTAREYGLTGEKRNDPVAQADAAAKMMATNANALNRTLGRPANAGELYLAHQQGLGGAKALLTNPGRPAVDVLAGVYGSREKAARAIQLNGGSLNQSAGQFAGQWVNKANQRVAMIPPGAIPNVVASQLDTQRPIPPLPQPRPAQRMVQGTGQAPTSAASRAVPTMSATPRLAPAQDGVFAYTPPDMQPAQITPGMGSLTPDFFRPQPQVRLPNIGSASSPIGPGPTSLASVQDMYGRPGSNVDPIGPGPSKPFLEDMMGVTMGGVGKPPSTRSVPSVPVRPQIDPIGSMPSFGGFQSQFGMGIPGPAFGPKDQARLSPGVYPMAPTGPAVASALSVVPNVPMPRPRPVRKLANVAMPTPMGQRPILPTAPQPLRVTVQGANSYNAPQPQYVSTTGQALTPRQTVRYNPDTNTFAPVTLYEPQRQERRPSLPSGTAQSLV